MLSSANIQEVEDDNMESIIICLIMTEQRRIVETFCPM